VYKTLSICGHGVHSSSWWQKDWDWQTEMGRWRWRWDWQDHCEMLQRRLAFPFPWARVWSPISKECQLVDSTFVICGARIHPRWKEEGKTRRQVGGVPDWSPEKTGARQGRRWRPVEARV